MRLIAWGGMMSVAVVQTVQRERQSGIHAVRAAMLG